MPLRSVALGSALAVLATSAHSAGMATYVNSRFGYSVSYPADLLIPEPEADNGDGRKFHDRHATAVMSVWGAYNADQQSPQDIARNYEGDCGAGKVGYEVAKPQLVAFSCITPAGRVIYQKTLIRHDVLTTVRFDYPAEEQAVWDPAVRQVSGSLSAGSGAK
jgi:hypothetical protein